MDDELICQDGEWFKPITPKEAFDVRLDVQLYSTRSLMIPITRDIETPKEWRQCRDAYDATSPYNTFDSTYWGDPNLRWFLKIDPTKPEYEPLARRCDLEQRSCDHEQE